MTNLRDKALARVLVDLRYENATPRTEIEMLQDGVTRYNAVDDTRNFMAELGSGSSGTSAPRGLTPSDRLAIANEVIYSMALNQYVSEPEL